MERQDIIDYIEAKFGVIAEYLWADAPEYAVFRNKRNKKWFAIMMRVEKSKLGIKEEGQADIINVKCDPIFIGSLVKMEGYFPAYHMNKQNWVTIMLGKKADSAQTEQLINLSFELVDKKNKKQGFKAIK